MSALSQTAAVWNCQYNETPSYGTSQSLGHRMTPSAGKGEQKAGDASRSNGTLDASTALCYLPQTTGLVMTPEVGGAAVERHPVTRIWQPLSGHRRRDVSQWEADRLRCRNAV